MYSVEIGAGRPVGTPYYRRNKRRSEPGYGPEEKSCGAQRPCHAFLSRSVPAIGPRKVVRSEWVKDYNYLTRANYMYLLRSVENYARLLGKDYAHTPGGSVGGGIANLYHELQELVGPDVSINFHTNEKRLYFTLWDEYGWGEYNVYWIPVSFVEKLPERLRRLAISFLHQFRKSQRIWTINMSDDLDFIKEWKYECAAEYDDENDRKEYLKYLQSYEKGGRIYKLLERIEKQCYHKRLPAALDRYVPASEYERDLVELMKEGLRFIGDDVPNIFKYAYDVKQDEDRDQHPLTPDQMILFIYKSDDLIDGYSEYVDDIYNNYDAIYPCATLDLAPDTSEPLGKDAFPKEFFAYMDKLNEFIRTN